MSPKASFVRRKPRCGTITIAPSFRSQPFEPGVTGSQASRLLPSKRTTASEGTPPSGAAITGGTGVHCSVSAGGGSPASGSVAAPDPAHGSRTRRANPEKAKRRGFMGAPLLCPKVKGGSKRGRPHRGGIAAGLNDSADPRPLRADGGDLLEREHHPCGREGVGRRGGRGHGPGAPSGGHGAAGAGVHDMFAFDGGPRTTQRVPLQE